MRTNRKQCELLLLLDRRTSVIIVAKELISTTESCKMIFHRRQFHKSQLIPSLVPPQPSSPLNLLRAQGRQLNTAWIIGDTLPLLCLFFLDKEIHFDRQHAMHRVQHKGHQEEGHESSPDGGRWSGNGTRPITGTQILPQFQRDSGRV